MALQILDAPPPEPDDLAKELQRAIEAALPDAEVVVRAAGPGHFEVEVVSAAFEGLSRVRQQQRVYAAIGKFMQGERAPVHAVDRMTTRTPRG